VNYALFKNPAKNWFIDKTCRPGFIVKPSGIYKP
jgi:hypothetical protein